MTHEAYMYLRVLSYMYFQWYRTDCVQSRLAAIRMISKRVVHSIARGILEIPLEFVSQHKLCYECRYAIIGPSMILMRRCKYG